MAKIPKKKTKGAVSFRQMLGPELLAEFGGICAWNGCRETFKGDMPATWRWLLTYHHAQSVMDPFERGAIDRDCALCPEHVRMIDDLLKALPVSGLRAADGETA